MSEAHKTSDGTVPVIPDKLYFRIGEVARLLGVETHTLRFWESEFPQLKVGKGGTGQRLYRRRDVETLLEIKQLLYTSGYTIPGARQLLQSRSRRKDGSNSRAADPNAAPPPPQTAEPVQPQRVASLQRLRADLRELSAQLGKPLQAAPGRQPNARPGHWQSAPPAQTPRRAGLHLAERTSTAPARPRLPGLFDPTEGS